MNVNPPDAWYWIEQRADGSLHIGLVKLMSGILIMRWDMVIGIEIPSLILVHLD